MSFSTAEYLCFAVTAALGAFYLAYRIRRSRAALPAITWLEVIGKSRDGKSFLVTSDRPIIAPAGTRAARMKGARDLWEVAVDLTAEPVFAWLPANGKIGVRKDGITTQIVIG